MIVTSADQVRPHIQTVTTYAADFDEVQKIELDADDIDEWQFVYTDVERTVYESQVSGRRLFDADWQRRYSHSCMRNGDKGAILPPCRSCQTV